AWTFGTATNAYGKAILLNGQTTPVGWGTEMEVANGNQLYADNSGGWYQWTGSGWSGTSDPTPVTASPPPPSSPPPPPPSSLSPDGTILLPGSGGSLVTSAGT